jgi:hypothetical protein
MRLAVCTLALLALLALGGCMDAVNRPTMSEFEPLGGDRFRYEATTAALTDPENDPDAEATRMRWLQTYLSDNGMCPDGYLIDERKPVVRSQTLGLVSHRIYYRGRCKT